MKIMERFIFVLFLISLEFAIIYTQPGEPNSDICDFETESYGPLPPPVPETFIMKAEFVDLENGRVFWEEQYFDSINLRAKFKTVHEGREYHYIFDYNVEQIISYVIFHPGVSAENDPESLETCIATNMEDNPLHRIFGYRYEHLDGKRTRMYNSYEVLQFGGNYKYAFNQTMKIDDRGIPSDVYHGCIYIPSLESTMDKTFYWSNKTLIPASGVEQIPVKIDTYGELFIYPKQDGKKVKVDVWDIENIPWFEGNPEFDDSMFQVPRRMYCQDYRTNKKPPNLPKYFSGRLEITTIERNMDGELQDLGVEQFTEIWYDSVSNMARVDYVTSLDDKELFLYMGEVPVSGVYDVSEGVVYYTNKLNGECVPFGIRSDFFLLSKESVRKLAPPNEVLGFDSNDLEYKGKNVARNVLCNVWAGHVQSASSSDDSKDFVEVYFAADDWHSDSDEDEEYDYPVRMTVIKFSKEKDNNTYETVSETNIFKYKATPSSPSVYDISGCRNSDNQKFFFFSIQKNVIDLLPDKREQFLRATREAIKDYSKIGSLLRVQDVDVYVPSVRKNVIISFTLLDTPQLFGQSSKQPGTSLLMAETNLRRAIDNADFRVQVVINPQKGLEDIRSLPGSLVEAIPQEADTYIEDEYIEEDIKYSYPLDERKDMLQVPDVMFSEKKDDNEGYSSGSLGGLAVGMLIVGIALGVGLMYFYLKKYGQQGNSPGILLEDRK